MKIVYEKANSKNSIEVVEMKFLNSYLDSYSKSRSIKKIKDRMSFLKYAIEYK